MLTLCPRTGNLNPPGRVGWWHSAVDAVCGLTHSRGAGGSLRQRLFGGNRGRAWWGDIEQRRDQIDDKGGVNADPGDPRPEKVGSRSHKSLDDEVFIFRRYQLGLA